ncbi:hypothetical protein GHK92_14715 [Nocardioides sp. dk4132]|uniref:hypothetical protein n=1 Tax=unclassified Nocardioides TaxID=2615069 RepID=UPI0012955B6B|nr:MULTISPECIES: hypothetical protein [unclassified Nocardioides]MQW77130.1 hypothetical protein [Nocardioides sp. dk4132]QGA06017.1 hypothetical protein GFH29_00335 [Nocardioides sp. dk884]
MSRTRPRALALTAPLLAIPLLAGCGLLDPPVLSAGGFGGTMVSDGRTSWFGTHLCLEDGEAEVTVEAVRPRGVSEDLVEDFDARIAWAPLAPAQTLSGHRGRLPTGFEAAAGASGPIGECGDQESYAWMVLGFPDADEPIEVTGLDLEYAVDGDTASSQVGLTWVQCPIWARLGQGEKDCVRLNRMGS